MYVFMATSILTMPRFEAKRLRRGLAGLGSANHTAKSGKL
jgi:hypothetical protein